MPLILVFNSRKLIIGFILIDSYIGPSRVILRLILPFGYALGLLHNRAAQYMSF